MPTPHIKSGLLKFSIFKGESKSAFTLNEKSRKPNGQIQLEKFQITKAIDPIFHFKTGFFFNFS